MSRAVRVGHRRFRRARESKTGTWIPWFQATAAARGLGIPEALVAAPEAARTEHRGFVPHQAQVRDRFPSGLLLTPFSPTPVPGIFAPRLLKPAYHHDPHSESLFQIPSVSTYILLHCFTFALNEGSDNDEIRSVKIQG